MPNIARRVNNPFTATRVTSSGSGTSGSGPSAETAGYRGSPMWPGITTGWDARCECTWAMRDGVYQVKVPAEACPHRDHSRAVTVVAPPRMLRGSR